MGAEKGSAFLPCAGDRRCNTTRLGGAAAYLVRNACEASDQRRLAIPARSQYRFRWLQERLSCRLKTAAPDCRRKQPRHYSVGRVREAAGNGHWAVNLSDDHRSSRSENLAYRGAQRWSAFLLLAPRDRAGLAADRNTALATKPARVTGIFVYTERGGWKPRPATQGLPSGLSTRSQSSSRDNARARSKQSPAKGH